ncbi:hypothetical protein IQ218_13840 [Synechocystis salina LEGE 06099]|uniref:hypothetical protein n=1 Tax=Synechocystis salina TaxID=945780 RepID=UPI00187F03FD|nr:hypothetical protein [Synechocystis salina]MBE9204321.1 hypothetical protein [Synechocystis salina LEGE 06099]
MFIKILGSHQILTAKPNRGKVRLNFQPLVDLVAANYAIDQYLFAHWNKVLELPAYYDPIAVAYYAAPESQIQILSPDHFWEGIERVNGAPLPSSCLVYPNATAEWFGKVLRIAPTD